MTRMLATILTLVGATLFAGCHSSAIRARNLPSQYAAKERTGGSMMDLSRAASPGISDALIGPDDLLRVTVASGREDERPIPAMLRVAQDGTVDVPLIGATSVAGMEAFAASQNIVNAAIDRGVFVRPVVTVEIASKAVKRVTVLGAVNKPGVQELSYGNCDLVTALAAAGGLSKEAGTTVEIIRQPTTESLAGGPATHSGVQIASFEGPATANPDDARFLTKQPQVVRLDLSDGQSLGASDTRLNDRDVVMIESRQKDMIYVTGLVTKPGQFELPAGQDIHLLDAIAMAGGERSPVADQIIIIRRLEGRDEPVLIRASLLTAKKNGAENIRLAAGDTISIEQTPATVFVDTFNKLIRFSIGVAGRTTTF